MEATKRCPKCDTTKPVGEFFKNKARHDGLSGYCRACMTTVNSDRQQRQRAALILALGGPVCRRCGFDDVRALTIDHVNGGGSHHRREAVSMWAVYKHAFENLDEYQVLCWNCNYIKRVENNENSSKEYVALVKTIERERMVKPVRWARDYDACTECGTTDAPHKSKGLCRNCYMRQRRGGGPVGTSGTPAKG